MYLSYYKLNKRPFQINTDPNFLWLGEKHKEALSVLRYGVSDDNGFLLLTGDVGTGKTTIINAFVQSLSDDVIIARVSDPGLTNLDFINYIAQMFKMEAHFETKSEFLILFTAFLEQAHVDQKKVLLIIDEAQQLTDATLEEIRLLSNIEKPDKKLLNIILVGQNEFDEILKKNKNRALRQRLATHYTLYPFNPNETRACIEFRLAVAGSKKNIFTAGAIDAIHNASKGFPRVINIICDQALRAGYKEKQKTITEEIIWECSKNLHLAHLPESEQYKNFSESTHDWLEESEVQPLSPEEIAKASQPLPDLTLTPEEPQKKRSSFRVIVPLFLATLLLTGFFVLKDDQKRSISQLLTNSYTQTVVSAVKKRITALVSSMNTKEPDTPEIVELQTDTESTISAPIAAVDKQQEKTEQEPEPSGITATQESVLPPPPLNQEPQDMVEQEFPAQPRPIAPQVIEIPVSTESTTMSNTALVEKEDPQPVQEVLPQPPVTTTINIALSEIKIPAELESKTQPEDLARTEEVKPPPPTKTITAEPISPKAPPKRVEPQEQDEEGQEDPGAVIDWLLESNKTSEIR